MFDSLRSSINETVSSLSSVLSAKIFGKNNERLDFVLDSFYKLPPEKRTGVLTGVFVLLGFLVVGIFALYFSRVNTLDHSLNDSAIALGEFRAHQIESQDASSDLERLKERIKSKMKSFSIKPFFEKISDENSVEIRTTKVKPSETVDLGELSSLMKEQDVEIVISKISIPKLLKFISAIEKKQKYIRVKDLRIRDLSGNKLYFEAQIFFRAFQLS